MQELVLSMEDISLELGNKELFQFKKLSVYQGERIGIIGKNGEGKSSLLKLIMGELESGVGRIQKEVDFSYFAQLPEELLVRAEAILQELESKEMTSTVVDTVQETKQENIDSSKEDTMSTVDMVAEGQLSLFQEEEEKVPDFCQELEQLDLMQTTPLDALLLLHRWQKEWRER